jgi:hypothetical protein
MLVAAIGFAPMCIAQPQSDWPNKEDYGPPAVIYPLKSTCGDLLRAKQGSMDYEYLKIWVMGFVSGQNSILPRGGNVLGGLDIKIDDFMFTLKRACEQDPGKELVHALYSTLSKIKPVDWKGQSMPNAK